MAIPHSELQKINPNSLIELFELELVIDEAILTQELKLSEDNASDP